MLATKVDNIQASDSPDRMRRIPKQLRSKRMVSAIVEAAFAILNEHGRKGLSTTSLEQVSGVPKSTTYDYFPNLDAVVAEVYYDVIHRHLSEGTSRYPLKTPQTILQFSTWLVDWALNIHLEMLSLDKDFYLRYSGHFDLWQALDSHLKPDQTILNFLSKQLNQCSDFQSGSNDAMYARALGRSLELMIYAMLRDNPEFIEQAEFRDMLIRIAYSIFPKQT